MVAIKRFLSRIRLRYRPSAPILKWVVLVTVVVCTVALIVMGAAIHKGRQRIHQKLEQMETLQQENQELAENIAQLGSVQSVVRIARERLGLEDPDAIVFQPQENTNPQ